MGSTTASPTPASGANRRLFFTLVVFFHHVMAFKVQEAVRLRITAARYYAIDSLALRMS